MLLRILIFWNKNCCNDFNCSLYKFTTFFLDYSFLLHSFTATKSYFHQNIILVAQTVPPVTFRHCSIEINILIVHPLGFSCINKANKNCGLHVFEYAVGVCILVHADMKFWRPLYNNLLAFMRVYGFCCKSNS